MLLNRLWCYFVSQTCCLLRAAIHVGQKSTERYSGTWRRDLLIWQPPSCNPFCLTAAIGAYKVQHCKYIAHTQWTCSRDSALHCACPVDVLCQLAPHKLSTNHKQGLLGHKTPSLNCLGFYKNRPSSPSAWGGCSLLPSAPLPYLQHLWPHLETV